MIHSDSVLAETLDLLKNIQSKVYMEDFILVGGTALALQLGHRKSIDLDFFCQKSFNTDQLQGELFSDFGFTTDVVDTNTLIGSINEIKVDLIKHAYPYTKNPIELGGVKYASMQDIAAMKLNAISNSGKRVKDFIDMYFLLKEFTLEEMLTFYCKKYGQEFPPLHVLKSLTYFDEVDLNDWPEMLKEKDLTWRQIKEKIELSVEAYMQRLKNEK